VGIGAQKLDTVESITGSHNDFADAFAMAWLPVP
jgi:hypothetical protein